MHLDDYPISATLFHCSRSAAIITSDRLTFLFSVVVKITRIPGHVSQFSKCNLQVFDGKISGSKCLIHPYIFTHALEGFKTNDGAFQNQDER